MSASKIHTLVRYLRKMTVPEEGRAASDTQLLQRFVSQRDETAFEVLVWRHGPMVLATCQRVLHDSHEAEDAFQATFLALFRQAASINKHQALAGWLYRVAYRISLRCREGISRRVYLQREISQFKNQLVPENGISHFDNPLDEELLHLPERYRLPIVLCHLQGKTTAEAARLLGCPRGTLLARLKRGRDRLRLRLELRGVVLSSSGLVALLSPQASPAAVSSTLVDATVVVAMHLAAGQSLESAVSKKLVALSQTVGGKLMLPTLLRVFALLLVGLGVGAAGFLHSSSASNTGSDRGPSAPFANQNGQAHAGNQPMAFKLGDATSARWSPDGKWLASYHRRVVMENGRNVFYTTFKIWDAKTGKMKHSLGEIKNQGTNFYCFSPDGKQLAISTRVSIQGGDHVEVWDVEKAALTHTIDMDYGRSRLWFDFSPDGKTLAVAYGGPSNKFGGGARLFDVTTGKLKQTFLEHKDVAVSLAFSPDGKTLATADYIGEIILWDLNNGKAIQRLKESKTPIGSLAFSPDGKTLASARSNSGLHLWNLQTGKYKEINQAGMSVTHVAFHPNGKLLAIGLSNSKDRKLTGEVKLWDISAEKVVHVWDGVVSFIFAFTPDGKSLGILHADEMVRYWNVGKYLQEKGK